MRTAAAMAFRALQRMGVSVTPNHFYWPIPDLTRLSPAKWQFRSELRGIDLDLDGQLAMARRTLAECEREIQFPISANGDPAQFNLNNGFFETVDAEIAYSLVRRHKPQRIIEVGSGNTTRLLATAVRRNRDEGVQTEFHTIDPQPDATVQSGIDGVTAVVKNRVQDVDLEFFAALGENDVLFIDSTHVVALDSDSTFEVLEVLPRLRKGVLIHFHDIFLPAEYPRKFVKRNLCFWSEQYLLQAFLSFNSAFKVVWSSSALQFARPNELRQLFPQWENSFARVPNRLRPFVPSYDGRHVWPCSFWIRKTE